MNRLVRVEDYCMRAGQKHGTDWFEWCVFIADEKKILEQIESVEYTLHPTFPNPVRRVKEREHRFALFSSGWGGFEIGLEIEWKDGAHTSTTHFLTLADPSWPKKASPNSFKSAETEKVYRALFSDEFRWRKASTLSKIVGISESNILKILHQLESDELVRKAGFLSIDKKELWGPTAVVGLSPRL